MLKALLARFHASDNELCDDLIYLDDDFLGRMAAANARSTTTITGDSANLQLDVSGHKERTRFVRQGGGWKIDPPEFFQPPTRGSPLKTKELKDRFSRERTLVETILFAVDQGKIATTRDAVGQLASGFEAIEAPPAAQMPSAATGPCTGPATTDKRAQRGTETPK